MQVLVICEALSLSLLARDRDRDHLSISITLDSPVTVTSPHTADTLLRIGRSSLHALFAHTGSGRTTFRQAIRGHSVTRTPPSRRE
jgi:hypothetical protein